VVISLPDSVVSAPLGPYDAPLSGTEVEVVGYPGDRKYLEWEREQVTRARVSGGPVNGIIQVDVLYGHPPIVRGYSGAAAVDVRSGRVVGMVVGRDENNRIAWIIPLAAIAEAWPELTAHLPESLLADPEFRAALADLAQRFYPDALRRFNGLARYYPNEADIYYYRVLAALNGHRPGGYQGTAIEQIVQFLEYGLRLNPHAAHLQALLALVEEDYYKLRGLKPKTYHEFPDIREISPAHAREIVDHIQAQECVTWLFVSQYISGRSP